MICALPALIPTRIDAQCGRSPIFPLATGFRLRADCLLQLEQAAIARLEADQVQHSGDGGDASEDAKDYSNLQVPRSWEET